MSMSNTSETKLLQLLFQNDAAYRHYKQLQEEEDIAYVMSILAAM